jgi:hypothetical protein
MDRVKIRECKIGLSDIDWEAMKNAAGGQGSYNRILLYQLNLLRFLRDKYQESIARGEKDVNIWDPFTAEEFQDYCRRHGHTVNGMYVNLEILGFLCRYISKKTVYWQVTENLLLSLVSRFPAK